MPHPPFVITTPPCTSCGGCASVCPVMAIDIREGASAITERCTACGRCLRFCPVDAIEPAERTGTENVMRETDRCP